MSPATEAQLAFGAEFATFLVSVAGVASALRPRLLSEVSWARSALASGFLGLAAAALLRGALTVPDPRRGAGRPSGRAGSAPDRLVALAERTRSSVAHRSGPGPGEALVEADGIAVVHRSGPSQRRHHRRRRAVGDPAVGVPQHRCMGPPLPRAGPCACVRPLAAVGHGSPRRRLRPRPGRRGARPGHRPRCGLRARRRACDPLAGSGTGGGGTGSLGGVTGPVLCRPGGLGLLTGSGGLLGGVTGPGGLLPPLPLSASTVQ